MRFLDTSTFIFALYKPRGRIDPKARSMKEARMSWGGLVKVSGDVVMTLVHITEVNRVL